MNTTVLFNFKVDKDNNRINVERSFNAPKDLVWAAWSESDILDQWWAPKPFQAVTKTMDFREGGKWHYAMYGPEGEEHWSLFRFLRINPKDHYSGIANFCDKDGQVNTDMPGTQWSNDFEAHEDGTLVKVELQFEKLEYLEGFVEMGFKEGFSAGLENLDQYIAAQFYLRKQNKPDTKPRVSSYVNFDGKTEEAFEFYRSVFKTEFINGIQRLGDLPPQEDQPPVADNLKSMVLHVELPLLGGHVLMGTDAPKEMGFTLTMGNNMHINLEPDSREEAQRLFDELSAGGKIEMPMQDMFWGAFYGNFQDKYGINWMVHYQKG